jgi:hypothetical protein
MFANKNNQPHTKVRTTKALSKTPELACRRRLVPALPRHTAPVIQSHYHQSFPQPFRAVVFAVHGIFEQLS